MKQHINADQLRELNKKQLNKLWFWYVSHNYEEVKDEKGWDVNFKKIKLSIGQMIEFLGDDWFYSLIESYPSSDRDNLEMSKPYVLCDILWVAVKNKLEEK